MTDIEQHDSVQVFVGVDVGKGAHHAVALDRKGKRLLDSALPNDETKLRALLGKLKEHGTVLLVVDQPATVDALPVAVACDEGVLVAYLPGLAMRRIADLHAGEAKTDARDAYIIAEAARSLPHTLRSLKLADGQLAELTMLCGFDEDLAGQITQVSNRIRGLLTQIHPALERVVGSHLDHPAMLDLLERYPSPAQLAALTQKQLANGSPNWLRAWERHGPQRFSRRSLSRLSLSWAPRLPASCCRAWRSSWRRCVPNAMRWRRKLSAWCLLTLFIRS